MKIKTVLAAAGLALGATAGSALADYTFTTIFSGNLAAGTSTSYVNNNLATAEAIPAGLYSGYEVFVDWQQTAPLSTSQWSSDMRVGFSSTGGSGTSLTGTLFTATGGVGPTNGVSNNNGGAVFSNLRFASNFSGIYSGGNPLQLGIRSSFGPATPSSWTNIRVTLKSFVPPAPPAGAIDLGLIGGNNTMAMGTTPYVTGQVSWFKFTLAQAVPAAVANKWLSVDTYGNTLSATSFGPNDTEIALYDSNGFLVGNNDDSNGNAESLLTYGDLPTSDWAGATGTGVNNGALAAGVYYIAVSPFNMTPGAAFAATVVPGTPAPGTTLAGDLKVTVAIPAPSSMALLGLGGLLAARRRRA